MVQDGDAAPGFTLAGAEIAGIEPYCVWTEKNLYGMARMGAGRPAFLFGLDGTILKSWRSVARCLEKAAMTISLSLSRLRPKYHFDGQTERIKRQCPIKTNEQR